MAAFRPVLAHYHLYPGGVSTLLLNSLEILHQKGLFRDEIVFVLGTGERSGWFFSELEKRLKGAVSVRRVILPRLMYWESAFGDVEDAAGEIALKFRELLQGGRVLWAHNPTLGKNPAYTLALKKLAEENPDQPIWMHVHDSAEQGRWANLELMQNSLKEPYYFISPGTRWIVINRSDYDAFLECGMPAAHLFHVPNPVPIPSHRPVSSKKEIGKSLSDYAARNGFKFEPDNDWLLFAGRTIRRKNLLEALLIALCCGKKLSFLLTLPADSGDDRPFDNMVRDVIRRHRLGVAGFGPELVNTAFPLNDLAAAANLLISCSVMEGFGLIYLEFPLVGKPFFARRNTAIDNLGAIRRSLPHYYFDGIRVPVEKSMRNSHSWRYRTKVEALAKRLSIPRERAGEAAGFFENHFKEERPDFSYLPASSQYLLLHGLDTGLAQGIRQDNPALFSDFDRGFHSGDRDPAEVREAVRGLFGPEVYAKNIEKLLKAPPSPAPCPFSPAAFSKRLLSFYFTPQNLRLLLDSGPLA